MIGPELGLHHLHLQRLSLIPPALVPIYQRQVSHTRQRVWIIGPELSLTSLHHLHKQRLSLVPPALVPNYPYKHRYTCQGCIIFLTQALLPSLPSLTHHPLRNIISPLRLYIPSPIVQESHPLFQSLLAWSVIQSHLYICKETPTSRPVLISSHREYRYHPLNILLLKHVLLTIYL